MGKQIANEEFLIRLYNAHGEDIIALDEYQGMHVKIRFKCKKGHVWYAEPHNVLRGSACPYCLDRAILVGYNDMWTTRPDIASLLKEPEDGHKYTKSAHIFTYFVCPQCGAVSYLKINDVYNRGFSCSRCSDGISYPNKFARSFLDQLPIDNYDYEYHPDWACNYFYDNYFEYNGVQYILEMDGEQHYRESIYFDKSLEERRLIDNIKTNLAVKNGIIVIRIDCFKSKCDYIKHNILSSELSDIFDLSDINWDLCDQISQRSLVKEACDLYTSGVKQLGEIAKILRIDRTTVHRYVKTGAKYGWCDYDPQVAIKEATIYSSKNIPIKVVDNNMNIIHRFRSIRDCQLQIKEQYGICISREKIEDSCKIYKPYKGFNFRFANETIQN